MRILLAIALSTIAAYLLNRRLFSRLGNVCVITAVPIVEELLKTGVAVLLGASLWWVHLGFGLLEAAFDIVERPRPVPFIGILAAGCSLIGHGAFAAVTIWGFTVTGQLIWGLVLGSGLHLLWNLWVVHLALQRGG